ncbi:aldehyde dehydrogenase family protein [Geochorda subterranea]|uniref:Aldehyde dehydrogenase family protein n=1 Tax=Geochorda subterranea TaxID=3109564 RepID=A0ABZ1BR18_9FIRM|nr:aldehyde dehydrogenase family protein [Limnochorda sp. LNt]WRP14896.1 aldehyde dehydrogenase family protein [Limnochorda sp. LNt]
MAERYHNFIEGEWVPALDGQVQEDRSPADRDRVVAEVPRSSGADVSRAVEAARRALAGWSRTSPVGRGEILYRAAAIVRSRAESIARLLSLEEGKPIGESRAEVARAAQILEYFGGEGARLAGETLPSSRPGVFLFTVREPLGVVGIVTPWNFPIAIPAWKLAPALVAGNTVVFKPASQAPATGLELVRALAEAGLPPGVLNAVVGPGSVVGEALLGAEGVRAVSFTGSTAVGSRLYQDASRRGLRCQCEMGGKNPLVVLADADLERAVEVALDGAFRSAGQRCTATSRIIVERPIAAAFVERFVERAAALRVGDPLDEATYVGPVVDETQMESILGYIRTGVEEGARLVLGGRRLTEGELGRGFYVAPTVFVEARSQMTIAQEEIFGPVVAILEAADFDEAVRLANDTRYGLSASVCTRDLARAHRFIREVEAGVVGVNVPTAGVEFQAPFGGTKASGTPFKEQGKVAVDFYSQLKTVALRYEG